MKFISIEIKTYDENAIQRNILIKQNNPMYERKNKYQHCKQSKLCKPECQLNP